MVSTEYPISQYPISNCSCSNVEDLKKSVSGLHNQFIRSLVVLRSATTTASHSPGFPSKLRSESFQIPVKAPLRSPVRPRPPKTLLRALPRPPFPGIPAGLPHRLPSQDSPQGALRAPHKVPTPGLLSDAPLRAPSQGPPQGPLRAPLGILSGLLRGGFGRGI